MDPSNPRRRCRQTAAEGPTSSLAAPWRRRSTSRRVPHRHRGTTGPVCLRVVVPLGSASRSARPSCASGQAPCLLPAPPHRFPKSMCPARLRRTSAGMPGHCAIGAGGPPHRRSTSPPGRSAQGLRPSRLPSPALSSVQSSLCPLRPLRRFCRSLVREDAAVRAARGPPVHPAAGAEAARVSPPLFLPLPLSSGQQADEDKVWGGITWCTRDCTRRFVLMLLLIFPFSDLRLVCVALPFVFDPSSTLPKNEVVAAPSRLQQRRS